MADRDNRSRQDIYELHLIPSTSDDISHVVEQLVEASPGDREVDGSKPTSGAKFSSI